MPAINLKRPTPHRVVAAVYTPHWQGFAVCEKIDASLHAHRWFTTRFDAEGNCNTGDYHLTREQAFKQFGEVLLEREVRLAREEGR